MNYSINQLVSSFTSCEVGMGVVQCQRCVVDDSLGQLVVSSNLITSISQVGVNWQLVVITQRPH